MSANIFSLLRYSPYSGSTPIATPEQLLKYTEAWTTATPPAGGVAAAGSSGFLYPSPQGAAGAYGAGDAAATAAGADQGEVAGLGLPGGKDVPLYRPSLVSHLQICAGF